MTSGQPLFSDSFYYYFLCSDFGDDDHPVARLDSPIDTNRSRDIVSEIKKVMQDIIHTFFCNGQNVIDFLRNHRF